MIRKQNSISRRRFLSRSAQAAAGALAMPYFVPSSVLAGPDRLGANERIVVGIVGMGVRGDQLVLNVPESGRVAAVCDADARKTAQARPSIRPTGKSTRTTASCSSSQISTP